MTFTVRLQQAYGEHIRINYSTEANTAKPGSDYQPVAGELTFSPGECCKTVVVKIIGDKVREADETFFLKITPAFEFEGRIGNGSATDQQRVPFETMTN